MAFRLSTSLLAALPLLAQTVAFDAASVKPSTPGFRGGSFGIAPGRERYRAVNTPLRLLISDAYGVRADTILGGPDWLDRDRFDIDATAGHQSTIVEIRGMLRDLLATRFGLRVHDERREMPAYVLTGDAAGPKIQRSTAAGSVFDQSPGKPHEVRMHADATPMDYFAWRLSRVLDRPVIDQTGLTGGFDFDLSFMEEVPAEVADRALAEGRPIDTRPSIFEALRQQLGLKLTAHKGPVDVIVVDKVLKPTEN